jgi:hypothetical protein
MRELELCIEHEHETIHGDGNNCNGNGNSNSSPVNSLESSMSTYDSMMQTLTDELNTNCGEFADVEDFDFFKMDCATAISFDYEMNYTIKQIRHIAGYYGIKCKSRKADMIQDIVAFETDASNLDTVAQRKRLFYYMDALKNDDYFKSFVMM